MNTSPVQRIADAAKAIRHIVSQLHALGYEFDHPDDVLPGVEPDTPEVIARIEHAAGPVPGALKAFWLEVGSVDLTGSHPRWNGCAYPDPLVVFPASYALEVLDEYLEDQEARHADGLPFAIEIAPDHYHKADVSGGPPYAIAVPATADDPPLLNERHEVSFLDYLALSLRWGGFPGLETCDGHTWPVERLRACQGG